MIPEEKSTDVLVEDVTIGEDGDLILVRVGGSHFIWKMVRRMVGVLVEVGKGQLDPDDVVSLLSGNPGKGCRRRRRLPRRHQACF